MSDIEKAREQALKVLPVAIAAVVRTELKTRPPSTPFLQTLAAEVLSLSTQEASREEVASVLHFDAKIGDPELCAVCYDALARADRLRERFVITRRTES